MFYHHGTFTRVLIQHNKLTYCISNIMNVSGSPCGHRYVGLYTDDTKNVRHSSLQHKVVLLIQNGSLFISVINKLDAQNFCFMISLFHASTCFEHVCSSSGGQNCTPIGVMIPEAV